MWLKLSQLVVDVVMDVSIGGCGAGGGDGSGHMWLW